MSNIYLNNSYWEKLKFSKFRFLSLKNSSPGQFLVSSNSRNYHRILRLLVPTNKSEVLGRNCLRLFSTVLLLRYFIFNKSVPVFLSETKLLNKTQDKKGKSKSPRMVFTMFTLSCIYSDSSNNTIKF